MTVSNFVYFRNFFNVTDLRWVGYSDAWYYVLKAPLYTERAALQVFKPPDFDSDTRLLIGVSKKLVEGYASGYGGKKKNSNGSDCQWYAEVSTVLSLEASLSNKRPSPFLPKNFVQG